MKAALTVWEGRISPVFDVSREVLVLTIENAAIVGCATESIVAPTADRKIDRLLTLGVETLICGAISEPLRLQLSEHDVTVVPFVAGEIEEVVKVFLAGELPTGALSMPGCRGRRLCARGEHGYRRINRLRRKQRG